MPNNTVISAQTDPQEEPQNPSQPQVMSGQEGTSSENVPQSHHRTEQIKKRTRFDKDGHPLISKGIIIRKDLDRKYSIKATFMGKTKYELFNDALDYYYTHILSKSQSEKLREAGVSELEI